MIHIKTDHDVAMLRSSAGLVGEVLAEMADSARAAGDEDAANLWDARVAEERAAQEALDAMEQD